MKILITGSKGFIGQNLIEYLPKDWSILSFDIKDNPNLRPKDIPLSGCDWAVHLGAISSTTETDVQKIVDLNVSWSLELFEECIKNGVNFQWSSSASVYGKAHTFNIKQKPQPANLYARSKVLLENYITMRNAPITWQGFRYFNVYGDYEDHKGSQASPYHQFSKQAKETGVIKIFEGSENYKRDFVPVENVCSYHEKFLSKKAVGIFNIGTGKPKSFLQVAQEIALEYDAKIETIPFPDYLRSHYQTYTCADMSLTSSIFNL